MKALWKAHIALFAAQVIYALNFSVAKGLMPHPIGPLALVLLRVAGASILFWLFSLFMHTQSVEKKDLLKLSGLALLGIVVNQSFFTYGLSLTEPVNSAIIMISNPVFVFILTAIILRERITFIKINGLLLAMAGAYIILRYRGNFESTSNTIAGDVMTLINSFSWAVFMVLAKPLMDKYNTITASRWMFLFSAVYMIPVGGADLLKTDWSAFTGETLFALIFVIVCTTFIAYFLNIYGLRKSGTALTSIYIYLQPFLATLFAVMLGMDTITTTKIVSGILIILGVYLVSYKSKKRSDDKINDGLRQSVAGTGK